MLQKKQFIFLLILCLIYLPHFALTQAFQGYTLYAPNNTKNIYLINMNNTIARSWTASRTGGYSTYLLEDGSILRTALPSSAQINGGGAQGVVQKISWSGTLLWEYTYSGSTYRAHHDIEPMPNGNVLIIAWEVKTAAQAVQAGLNHSASIWPDHIIEVQPVGTNGGNIVWRWHFWDHLIQDFDPTKNNYGVVADHPELLDINVGSTVGDWMHVNGISYNPLLDQIVFSSHNLNEIYVIDHSTTIQEAAGHTGGRWGKGGDILYRWGKPANYRAPGTQVFRVVHCSAWIPDSLPGGGHIIAFNNREGLGTSMIVEIITPTDSSENYIRVPGTAYGPTEPIWSYTASNFYSNHLGGVQRLPNGNTLIAQSTSGRMFEVTSAGTVVWNYQPGGEIVRALRYPPDYSGLSNLTNADEDATDDIPRRFQLSQNYPNPFNPATIINYQLPIDSWVTLKLYNVLGQEVAILVDEKNKAGSHDFDFRCSDFGLSSGVYFYRLVVSPTEQPHTKSFVQTKKLLLMK